MTDRRDNIRRSNSSEGRLISRAALLNAAVIELQGQETDSSPVDEKIPVFRAWQHFLSIFFTLMIFYHGKRQNSRGWQEDVRF